jgi:drug/metabolite transporter (DMT)-like permease
MNAGLIGGLLGCALGLAGGLIGTWASIKNTNGPRERAFTIRAAVIGWTAGVVFLALLLFLTTPWRFLLWLAYGILLPLGILTWNRKQQRIRRQEAQELSGRRSAATGSGAEE